MPATLKPKRTESARPRPAAVRPEASKLSEDRQAYRRTAPAGGDKKADVGAGANPNLEFVSFVNVWQICFVGRLHLNNCCHLCCREEDMDVAAVQHLSKHVPTVRMAK